MFSPKNFGDRLHALRKEQKLILEKFAEPLGVTKQAVGRWEKGERQPSLALLSKIAESYEISTDYLLGLSDRREQSQQGEGQEYSPKLLSERMKFLRKQKGLTLEQFGVEIGVTKQTTSRWETGLRQPSLEMLAKVAEFYGVSADYLLGLSDKRERM